MSDQIYNEEGIFEILSNTDVDSLSEDEAKEFCKLIEEKNKAIVNQFSFMVSNTQNQNIAKAIVPYVTSEEIGVRNLAGELLINMGETAVPALTDQILDGDKHKKKFIIDVLGLIGDPRPADKIIQVMKTDDDENVILACIEALGNIKSEKSVAHLIRLYSVNELFIPSIIEALGKIGSDAAIDFIMESYKTDDELIKYSIVESLGNIGNPQSFYFLLSELKNLSGPISWAAVESIYKLSNKFNLEVPFEESFKNKILDTLYDADPQFKKSALSLVIGFDDAEIFDAFLSVLGSDYEIDEMVKDKLLNNVDATVKGIHKRLDSKAENISSLLSLLEEMCESQGLDFNQYFQPLERQAFLDSLAAALDLPTEEARKSAMNLLFKISPDYAFLFLDKMLSDDNLWNRLFVLDILEGYSLGEEELNILSGLADKADDMVRERIIDLVEFNRSQMSTQN